MTIEQLAEYLHKLLSHTAAGLGWDVESGSYSNIVLEAVEDLGFTLATIDEATPRDLRARARFRMWEAVAAATAGDYNFSADGGSFSREQVHEHALEMAKYEEAQSSHLVVSSGYAVTQAAANYPGDPSPLYEGDPV